MSCTIPSMDEIRRRIRAALETTPGVTGAGLAGALGISKAQVSALLKGRRKLHIDDVLIVERYLGIDLIDVGVEPLLPENTAYQIKGTEYVAYRQDKWITVLDGDAILFMVRSTFPLNHLAAVVSIRAQAFRNGEQAGRSALQYELRLLLGAAAEPEAE